MNEQEQFEIKLNEIKEKDEFSFEVNILRMQLEIINKRIELYKRVCIGLLIFSSFILIYLLKIILMFN